MKESDSNAIVDESAAKFQQWSECLDGPDRHSVMHQISRMMWNTAAFEIINETRRFARANSDGTLEINALVHNLINSTYFESQMAAIRRLLDKSPIQGDRSVYSLGSLLQDMKTNIALLTRENIFRAQKLEFDIERISKGENVTAMSDHVAMMLSTNLHEEFDRLAGVCADRRSRNDLVRREVIDALLEKLADASKKIKHYVDKCVAHAASPEDRISAKTDDLKLTLECLRNAERVIYQVANFVSINFLSGTNQGSLPIPQYDHLEFIDRPLIETKDLPLLHKKWRDIETEIDRGRDLSIDDLLGKTE